MSLEETTINSVDGLRLTVRRWTPDGRATVGQIVIIHGYFEHGGRYEEVASCLSEAGFASTVVDLRGHGKSEGMRGHLPTFNLYLDDLVMAMKTIPDGPRFVLGHSLGGLIALHYTIKHAAKLSGLVLTNPFLGFGMRVPPWKVLAARLVCKFNPLFAMESGIIPEDLTHDVDKVQQFRNDPFVFTKATVGWYNHVVTAQKEALAINDVACPLYYVIGTADCIAAPTANLEFSRKVNVKDKTVKVLAGQFHEVLNETKRKELYTEMVRWLKSHLPKEATAESVG